MKKSIISIVSAILMVSCGTRPESCLLPYQDRSLPVDERVEDALSRMTLEEKIAIIHAQSKFSSPGVPRLGIPELWCSDGPHGIRPEVKWDEWNQAGWTNDSCMAFPALTCLAATWNEEMSALYGRCIGEEARYREKDVLLGPGVNIYRTPLNGRNFEYMGEDPYLASRMVVPYIKGVQSNGVAACVKHYALNNQERNRHTTDVELSDRALYEIYLPAFRAAVVEGDVWSIMGSYNLYRGEHCCHNRRLLKDILRDEWGFKGTVISDWGGTHDTAQAIANGLDLEFGSWTNGLSEGTKNAYDNYFMAFPYLELIREEKAGTEELDGKVRNVLSLNFRTAMNPDKPLGSLASPEHALAARRIAEDGIVLLKNDRGVLPLSAEKVRRIAVIGENAVKMMTVGGGSSSLKAKYEVSPLDGLMRRAAESGIDVVYARGYAGENVEDWDGVSTGRSIRDDRSEKELVAEAVEAARSADCVVFFGGLNKNVNQDCEDSDRVSLSLPYNQDELLHALAEMNGNVIMVNISGNAVAMPWLDEVPAVIQAWYCGSEAGNALAAVLFGDVNPSGKLPFTFPARLEDVGAHSTDSYGTAPGKCTYAEDIFVGYRWTESRNITPLFPFGHGLSYTEFSVSDVRADRSWISGDDCLHLSAVLTNVGSRTGSEVLQLYIGDEESSLPRPVKELKGFEKVLLEPGESRTVTFTVSRSDLEFFDDGRHEWTAEPGRFNAYVGTSSADIKAVVPFDYK